MGTDHRSRGNVRSPKAVKEVLSGSRKTANAAWWGFDEEDSTDALQGAIDSGASRVLVPNMTKDWVVRPLNLAGNQELVFEQGVVVTAKRGEYRGRGDCVFTARDVDNLVMRGYGATVRMQKEDYIVGKVLLDFGWERWFGSYEKGEWRMPISLRGCSNVEISGLTLSDSGGDGIMVSGGGRMNYCRNIRLRDVVCDNNYRQGISVISVDGLTAEGCVFKNTWGTPPSSGLDVEPDSPQERIRDLVFRDCLFQDNYGDGIELFLTNMREESGDVSMLFERCRVTSNRGAGIRVTKIRDDGPGGLIEFRDCVVENTVGYGIKVQDKSVDRAALRFVNCTVRNVAGNRAYMGTCVPVWFHLFKPDQTRRFGGIEFAQCTVEDDHDRPVAIMEETESQLGIHRVSGTIDVRNAFGARMELGGQQEGVSLSLRELD